MNIRQQCPFAYYFRFVLSDNGIFNYSKYFRGFCYLLDHPYQETTSRIKKNHRQVLKNNPMTVAKLFILRGHVSYPMTVAKLFILRGHVSYRLQIMVSESDNVLSLTTVTSVNDGMT